MHIGSYKNEVVPQPFLWAGIILLIGTIILTIGSAISSIH